METENQIEKVILRIAKSMKTNIMSMMASLHEANVIMDGYDKYSGIYFLLLPILSSKVNFQKIQNGLVTRELLVTLRFMKFHYDTTSELPKDSEYLTGISELRNAELQFLHMLKNSAYVKERMNGQIPFTAESEVFFFFTDSNLWGIETKIRLTAIENFDCIPCVSEDCV